MNLTQIVLGQNTGTFASMGLNFLSWNWLPLLPLFVIYVVSSIAETNRHPFDVAEGESEIVAGHMVEYSGMSFAMFFLAEYANMILLSTLATIMFLGGWAAPIDLGRLLGFEVAELDRSLSGWFWLFAKVFFVVSLFHLVPRLVSALPLRPDHAARLEGIHSADAGVAGGDRGLDADAAGTSGAHEADGRRQGILR